MTAKEIFDSTGDVYLSLIHPEINSLLGSEEFTSLLRLADTAAEQSVAELIYSHDWRERIVGFAIAARKRSWNLARAVSDSLLDPRGIAIVPAGAFLITSGRVGKIPLDDLLPATHDPDVFDGEVAFAIDCLKRSLSAKRTSVPSETGPNYGQNIQVHTKLHVMLPAIGDRD